MELDTTHVRLCGRDNERRTLKRAWGQAKSEQTCQMVVISGESGSGKSALVEDFRDGLQHEGHAFFFGGKFDQGPALEPFDTIIASLNQLAEQMMADSSIEWQEELDRDARFESRRIALFCPRFKDLVSPPREGEAETLSTASGHAEVFRGPWGLQHLRLSLRAVFRVI